MRGGKHTSKLVGFLTGVAIINNIYLAKDTFDAIKGYSYTDEALISEQSNSGVVPVTKIGELVTERVEGDALILVTIGGICAIQKCHSLLGKEQENELEYDPIELEGLI